MRVRVALAVLAVLAAVPSAFGSAEESGASAQARITIFARPTVVGWAEPATLYGAARGVARMVAAGAVDPLDAVAALTAAGRRAEQTDRDINAAIVGGFKAEHVSIEGIAA